MSKTGFLLSAAVPEQHRHIRAVKRGISFPNSPNLTGFKGLPGGTQLSAALKLLDFVIVDINNLLQSSGSCYKKVPQSLKHV